MDCGRGGSGRSSQNDATKQHSIFGREKAGIQGSSETGGGRRMLVVGWRKNGSGDENESCSCLRCSFFTGSRCCVHYIPTQPNSFRGGGDILPPPDPPGTKKWRYTAEQKCQYTKSQPNPIFLPPSPLLGGAAVGILKEGLQPARQGWGSSHTISPPPRPFLPCFFPQPPFPSAVSHLTTSIEPSPPPPSHPFLSLSIPVSAEIPRLSLSIPPSIEAA